MLKYSVKRLLQSLFSIFLIVTTVFLLLRLMPTDYYFTEDELMKLNDKQKTDKLQAAGLLDHPLVQLGHFYGDMFELKVGNFYTEENARDAENYAAALSDDTKIQGSLKNLYKKMAESPETFNLTKSMRSKIEDYLAAHPEDAMTAKLLEAYDNKSMDDQLRKELARTVGTNIFHVQVNFDLGDSRRIQSGKPVLEVIGDKFGVSMQFGLIALCISLLLGVTLGVVQARYKDSLVDNVLMGYTVLVHAVPALVLYMLIQVFGNKVFGLGLRYAPGDTTTWIMPVICLSLVSIAGYMLWIRRYMVDELNKDYIRLARLKGLTTQQVMFKHVLKNAFVPMAQQLPVSILLTVGGSLLVEKYFAIPGMGPMLTDAIGRYDCNMVQGIVLLYSSLGIVGLFIGDVLMTLIDPRIRLTTKGGSR